MTTATLNQAWTEIEMTCGVEYQRPDGKAAVSVIRTADGWVVRIYEATGRDGLDHPASYVGSEPANPSRTDARRIARRWMRRLS